MSESENCSYDCRECVQRGNGVPKDLRYDGFFFCRRAAD